MKSDYTTNSCYITHTIAFWKVGRIHFLSSGVKGLICYVNATTSSILLVYKMVWGSTPLQVMSAVSYHEGNCIRNINILIFPQTAYSREGEDGATALHYAARFRANKLKPSSSQRNVDEEAPLQSEPPEDATDSGEAPNDSTSDVSMITFLVDKGADINCQDKYGWTPLHFAASKRNILACTEVLAVRGINVNVWKCYLGFHNGPRQCCLLDMLQATESSKLLERVVCTLDYSLTTSFHVM